MKTNHIKITGVIPVHNEEFYLPYSLPALCKLSFDELVFVLDRCTDNSERLIRKYVPKAKIVLKHEGKGAYGFPEVFQRGFDEAQNDIVFALGADVIVTEQALTQAKLLMRYPAVGALFYGFTRRPVKGTIKRIHQEHVNFLKRFVVDKVSPYRNSGTGVYCFRKSLARMRDVPCEYVDLLDQIREKGFKTVYVPDAGIIHLRVALSKEKQVYAGKVRAELGESFTKAVLHSVLNLKFWTLLTYLRLRKWGLKTW